MKTVSKEIGMNMTAIAIVAIVCWALVSIIDSLKSNQKHKTTKATQAALENDIEQLKQRVETLEKIVTDKNYDLHKEFDKL